MDGHNSYLTSLEIEQERCEGRLREVRGKVRDGAWRAPGTSIAPYGVRLLVVDEDFEEVLARARQCEDVARRGYVREDHRDHLEWHQGHVAAR